MVGKKVSCWVQAERNTIYTRSTRRALKAQRSAFSPCSKDFCSEGYYRKVTLGLTFWEATTSTSATSSMISTIPMVLLVTISLLSNSAYDICDVCKGKRLSRKKWIGLSLNILADSSNSLRRGTPNPCLKTAKPKLRVRPHLSHQLIGVVPNRSRTMRHEGCTRPIRIPLALQGKELVVKPFGDLVRRYVHLVRRVAREVDDIECLCDS